MKKTPRRRVIDDKQKVNVYSYYGTTRTANSNEDSRNIGRKTAGHYVRAVRRISIGRLIVIFLFLIAVGVLLSASTAPIIRISDEDTTARSASTYREETEKIIKSSLLNHTKLTFDYNGAEKKLKEKFPEIEDARITFDLFGRRPVIQLILYPPAFRVESSGHTWVVDSRGVAIGKAAELGKDQSQLPLVKDEIGLGSQPGISLLSPVEVTFLKTVLDILEKKSLQISDIYIPRTPKELDIQLTGEGYRYKLNTEEKASDQAGELLATRETLQARGEAPTEYVDLRAGEKVFWK